jgi:7,8-dihydropterin-6-yl-methyl-4-(beta-D-ribofuranosyl)aminobenzene 5'-phosphate synthase
MELSLAIETPEGMVLVVGCSHPTLERIVEAAKSVIDAPIQLILGGTHLLTAQPEEISRIARALHDEWHVAWIAPAHCTGEPAFASLKQRFADRYFYAGLGPTLELGREVTVKAEAGYPVSYAMGFADLASYRSALARGALDADSETHGRLASVQP